MKFKNLKRILALTLMVTMISSSMVFAEEGNIESTKTDVSSSSSLSDKEIAINNLLNGGWTMSEIKDLISDSELTKYTNLKPVKSVTKYLKLVQKKKDVKESKIKSKQSIQNTEIDEDTEFVEISEDQCKFELEQAKAKENSSDGSVNLSDTLSNTGILNLTQLASTPPPEGSSDFYSNDGYLKYTISAWYAGGTKYSINYRWQWLKDPKYTSVDVFGLGHDGGIVRSVSDPTTYVYKYDYYVNGFATENQENTPEYIKADTGGVVFATNLKDRSEAINGTYVSWYGNHRGYVSYYVNKQSPDISVAYVYGCYKHLQKTVEPEVSISWPLSASLTVSPSDDYVEELPNAEFDFSPYK
ncbi:hypothetical protein [Clostridium sp. BNL1100]|uniref:hypothetical protein n=1 Tax=Clostridium sp. BNL1100 TaxID=755731 RepID=UPI00024A78D9|nr:hypothetical protein [Clostridium sp. BNL1100]AEY64845.1 hypothetical protein Clo1100_0567 [Clostridium sp. BNL1100]